MCRQSRWHAISRDSTRFSRRRARAKGTRGRGKLFPVRASSSGRAREVDARGRSRGRADARMPCDARGIQTHTYATNRPIARARRRPSERPRESDGSRAPSSVVGRRSSVVGRRSRASEEGTGVRFIRSFYSFARARGRDDDDDDDATRRDGDRVERASKRARGGSRETDAGWGGREGGGRVERGDGRAREVEVDVGEGGDAHGGGTRGGV